MEGRRPPFISERRTWQSLDTLDAPVDRLRSQRCSGLELVGSGLETIAAGPRIAVDIHRGPSFPQRNEVDRR